MATIGFRCTDADVCVDLSFPGFPTHRLRRHEILELDRLVCTPHTAWASKIGNARFRADAGTREDHRAAALIQQRLKLFQFNVQIIHL